MSNLKMLKLKGLNPGNSHPIDFLANLKRFVNNPTNGNWKRLCVKRPPCGLNMGGVLSS